MNDSTTGERIIVNDAGIAGPYIIVPLDQLDDVCRLLKDHQISFEADEWAVSSDDEPLRTVVTLGRGTEARRIQQVLDQRC